MPECLYINLGGQHLGVFGINIWGFDEKTGRCSLTPIQSEGLLFARKNATLTEVAPFTFASA